MKPVKIVWTVLIVSIIVNIGLGILVSRSRDDIRKVDYQSLYPLLSKRIFIDNPNDSLINFYPLRTHLREIVAPWDKTFAFYFEYLPTGMSIGVNEKIDFDAA